MDYSYPATHPGNRLRPTGSTHTYAYIDGQFGDIEYALSVHGSPTNFTVPGAAHVKLTWAFSYLGAVLHGYISHWEVDERMQTPDIGTIQNRPRERPRCKLLHHLLNARSASL